MKCFAIKTFWFDTYKIKKKEMFYCEYIGKNNSLISIKLNDSIAWIVLSLNEFFLKFRIYE